MAISCMQNGIMVCGGRVMINGEFVPPCPAENTSTTIINNKVYIGGYEFKNGKWKRTWRALWYSIF